MKYKVFITRTFGDYFYVDAENEEQAIDKAEEEFEEIVIHGYEMLPFEQEIEDEEE